MKTNKEGLTFGEWILASGHADSRRTRKAWRDGEDPTDWMAARPARKPEPPPAGPAYEYVRQGRVPDDLKVGDFVHDTSGTWELWRVTSVYGADSPHFLAVNVTGSKFRAPCSRTELLRKDRHVIEPDPVGFVRCFGLSKYGSLVALKEVDHNDIEGRSPIMRTHYLYELPGLGPLLSYRWYVTIDGSSRTWLDSRRTFSFLSGATVVDPALANVFSPAEITPSRA